MEGGRENVGDILDAEGMEYHIVGIFCGGKCSRNCM